jgi:hypothetical protein
MLSLAERSNRENDPSDAKILTVIKDAIGMPVDEAAPKLVEIIDNSTRGKEGGEFVNIDGSRISW